MSEDSKKNNGIYHCSIHSDFHDWKKEARGAIRKVEEMHTMVTNGLGNLAHLETIADEARAQTKTLGTIEQNLIGPATQRDQIGMKSHLIAVGVLGLVILALTFVVVFQNTGREFDPAGIFKKHLPATN